MIEYYKRTILDEKIKKILNFEVGCWMNVIDPSEEELEFLVKEFNLDKRNLESALDENELPRLEIVKEDIYVFTKVIPEKTSAEVFTYLILISKEFILTLCKKQPDFIEKIIQNKIKFVTTQKLKCLIQLFFFINRSFERATAKIVKEIKRKKIESELKEKEIEDLLSHENTLNELVSAYNYLYLLYQKILRKIEFYEQDKNLIEDLIVEANQGLELCKSSLKAISNLRNYYTILLSNKLNRTITILTAFTILLSIMGAISGLFGMNVSLPWQTHPLIFYFISFIIFLLWAIFLLYLKAKKII